MAAAPTKKPGRIFLFDVDGTLTVPRNVITPDMHQFILDAGKENYLGVVGGSDFVKIQEQLGNTLLQDFDYVFSENGLVAHKNGELINTMSFKDFIGEEKLKKFINFVLHYIADLDIPIKRGTFIEFRNGMLNISPIGRNCSQQERVEFEQFDLQHNIRKTMVSKLKEEFADYGLTYSIGGQISFDVFPIGWDKTYCLPFVKNDGFTEIHFFGDKCFVGGNDHEIFTHPDTIGHEVVTYKDTMEQVRAELDKA